MSNIEGPDTGENQDAAQSQGIDPLDIFKMEGSERELINWLSRQKNASLDEIKDNLGLSDEELDALISELVAAGKIQESELDGVLFYSCSLKGSSSRRLRGFPDDLWRKAGLEEDD